MASGVDGRAIRDARERADLTQHQLARVIGVAGGERVSSWERGAAAPTPATLRRVAEQLRVPVADLVWFDGDDPDLRALRLRAGLDANDVALAAHVSPQTYWRWEAHGVKRLPSDPTLELMAEVLGVKEEVVRIALAASRGQDHPLDT